MERSDRIDLYYWIAALFAAVALMGVAALLHDGYPKIAWACAFGGALLCLLFFLRAVWLAGSKEKNRSRMLPTLGTVVFGSCFIASAAWYFWPTTTSPALAIAAPDGPEVTMALENPEYPSFQLINMSNKNASQIKVSVVLWNIDDPRIYMEGNKAPDAHDPLLIPVQTFDFLRPRTTGMVSIFNTPIVSPYVKVGQRLVGSAGVVCPECGRGHSYHLYINYGQGGWIAEIPEKKEGELMAPIFFRKPIITEFFKLVMKTPETVRLPILSDPSAIGSLDEPPQSPAR